MKLAGGRIFSLSPDGAELVVCKTSGTIGMHACQVAAENEYFIVAQFRYHFRCISWG